MAVALSFVTSEYAKVLHKDLRVRSPPDEYGKQISTEAVSVEKVTREEISEILNEVLCFAQNRECTTNSPEISKTILSYLGTHLIYIPLSYALSYPPEETQMIIETNSYDHGSFLFSGQLTNAQKEDLPKILYCLENTRSVILSACCGYGKSLKLNTPVLMFDGSIKLVQDIVVGDVLMGDDLTPRNVLTLGRGRDDMYKITHKNGGDSYTVNSEHILCLEYYGNKRVQHYPNRNSYCVFYFDGKEIKMKSFTYYGEKTKENALNEATEYLNSIDENRICEIPVKNYLKLEKTLMNSLKGYSVGVEFPYKEIDFDPYIIGYWLGDGTSASTQITTKILQY